MQIDDDQQPETTLARFEAAVFAMKATDAWDELSAASAGEPAARECRKACPNPDEGVDASS